MYIVPGRHTLAANTRSRIPSRVRQDRVHIRTPLEAYEDMQAASGAKREALRHSFLRTQTARSE